MKIIVDKVNNLVKGTSEEAVKRLFKEGVCDSAGLREKETVQAGTWYVINGSFGIWAIKYRFQEEEVEYLPIPATEEESSPDNIVGFKQARALKEIGFPQDAFYDHYYTEDGKRYWMKMSDDYGSSWSIGQYHFSCVAPTLEAVAKWFREKKGIIIVPKVAIHLSDVYEDCVKIKNKNGFFTSGKLYPTYEEALSVGIDNAIELVKS